MKITGGSDQVNNAKLFNEQLLKHFNQLCMFKWEHTSDLIRSHFDMKSDGALSPLNASIKLIVSENLSSTLTDWISPFSR